jgi:hypothetical protein
VQRYESKRKRGGGLCLQEGGKSVKAAGGFHDS